MKVFFYGLLMDERLLREKGIKAQIISNGFVNDFELRIGERATLICNGSIISGPRTENIAGFGTGLIDNEGSVGTTLIDNRPRFIDKRPITSDGTHAHR